MPTRRSSRGIPLLLSRDEVTGPAGFVVLLYKIFCVVLTYIFATVSYHRVATTLKSDEMDTFNRAPTFAGPRCAALIHRSEECVPTTGMRLK